MTSTPEGGKRLTAAVICPGRGTYTKTELGYLKRFAPPSVKPLLADLDQRLLALGRPTVTELDSAEKFNPKLHTPGENASTLIYACSAADFASIAADRYEIVAVTGNSMGWYTALALAGALDQASAFRVIHTMGSMMQSGIIGGQVIYPLTDPVTWKLDPDRRQLVDAAIREVSGLPGCEAYWSIRFGGYAIIGANERALSVLMKSLPQVEDGKYPFVLVNHAAFHTPLLAGVAAKAETLLGLDLFQAPHLPLVDGRGAIWQPYATDAAALRTYTLGHQVTETYDFSAAVAVTLKEFAPDRLILLGPGATSGGAVGQILVDLKWWGIDSKEAFTRRQAADPVLVAMGREDQRSLVARGH